MKIFLIILFTFMCWQLTFPQTRISEQDSTDNIRPVDIFAMQKWNDDSSKFAWAQMSWRLFLENLAATSFILDTGSVTTLHILNGTILSEDIAEGVIGESKLSGAFTSTLIRTTGNQTGLGGIKTYTSGGIRLNNAFFGIPLAISTSPVEGDIYYRADQNRLRVYDTGAWVVFIDSNQVLAMIDSIENASTYVTRTGDGETISGDKIFTGTNRYPSNDAISWNPGSQSVDVSQYREVTIWDIGQTTVTVTDFTNAVDGQIISIIIKTNAQDYVTIDHGTEISLIENVDYVMEAGDALTLYYDSSDDMWNEISRSNINQNMWVTFVKSNDTIYVKNASGDVMGYVIDNAGTGGGNPPDLQTIGLTGDSLKVIDVPWDLVTFIDTSITAAGYQALFSNTTGGIGSTAFGYQSLFSNTTGDFNTSIGYSGLNENTTGSYNISMGYFSLHNNISGNQNTALGSYSLWHNTGHNNTAIGNLAGGENTVGEHNIMIGNYAGRFHSDSSTALISADRSIYIGAESRGKDNNDDNSIVIGFNAIGKGANTVVLGNDNIDTTFLKGIINLDTIAAGEWQGTTIAISEGGTGAVNQTGAINNLLPSQVGNDDKFLKTNGTNSSWTAVAGLGLSAPDTNTTNNNWSIPKYTTGSAPEDSLAKNWVRLDSSLEEFEDAPFSFGLDPDANTKIFVNKEDNTFETLVLPPDLTVPLNDNTSVDDNQTTLIDSILNNIAVVFDITGRQDGDLFFWDLTSDTYKPISPDSLGGSTDTTFIYQELAKKIPFTDTTSAIAKQWELDGKLNRGDTTGFRTFSDLKYLENGDSTNQRTFSDLKYLADADTNGFRTFSDLKYLENADSTAQRTFSDLKYRLISNKDTMTISWGIMDTVTVGILPGWKVPYDITIVDISSFTDANTTTFNIEERVMATPNTAGTDAISSDQVADNNNQVTTSFTNAVFSKDTWAVPTISATGDVATLSITMRYVKVY